MDQQTTINPNLQNIGVKKLGEILSSKKVEDKEEKIILLSKHELYFAIISNNPKSLF